MDESHRYDELSEKDKIRALKLVVSADGYLAQHQLLKALNHYKYSVEILPDPAIIRKIKKLRKYMKRNGMDIGENKENEEEHNKSNEKRAPSDTTTTTTTPQHGANKTLRERMNSGINSDNATKDNLKTITDTLSNIKFENVDVVKREVQDSMQEKKDIKMDSASPPTDLKEAQSKGDVGHQKPRLPSSNMSPKPSSLNTCNREDRLSRIEPPVKAESQKKEKPLVNSDEPIRCFKDLQKRMYPHQKVGMKWLAQLFGKQRGGILGDDMGLGKTLQVIGYLSRMFEVNEIEHVLVVLPTALVLPWQSEISRWAPSLNYALYHGKTLKQRVKLLHNLQRQGGILLTTYGLIVTNYEELSKGPDGQEFVWDYVFLDEGHKIKNPTKTQKAAHYIPAKNRIIITGTPIQNNLMELWSLFDFVHHGSLLGTIKTFKINYENPIIRARQKDATMGEKQHGFRMSQNLQKIIAPYFLRRTKAQLMADPNSGLPSLPRKNDIIVWVKMTEDQQKVYESYLKLDEVKELMHSSRSPLVALNILKKLCDHLRLLSVRICKALGMLTAEEIMKNAQDRISHLDDPNEVPEWTRQIGTDEPVNPAKQIKDTECAATQLTGIPDSLLYKESAKLSVAIELLSYLSATGHKCLVFSQSTKMLDIIQQILTNLSFRHVRMDGQITQLEQRAEIIRKFETDKNIPIFLLTTQVGGVGLNLTVADRIIIMDPSWNPAIDSQAVDRIYRIGQKKNVIIFRLITCGSVEEKIYIRQLFKLSINKQTTKESKDPFRYFTKQDLKQLFIVEDLSVSETQLQLTKMHRHKRVSDEIVEDQIKFLESMDDVFGVSDHDLVFSTEDNDREAKMSNERLETMVVRAEEALRNEINYESQPNSKKLVPGIQERRQPSVEKWDDEPPKSLSSPLFSTYGEEETKDEEPRQREVRHRRSNAEPHSISSEAIELSDEEEEPAPHQNKNNNDDDVIILSDAHSDNNEVIMDSEDEQPPRSRQSTLSAFNKHSENKARAAEESLVMDSDTPSNRNHSKGPNSRRQSLANKTLMRAIADSPHSPMEGSSKNVLVADSPDVFSKSSSSASQHSSDELSPSNNTKFTVAESDYDSDENMEAEDAVMESQDEDEAADRSRKNVNNSKVEEDDSREFCSPAFRDVSVVVPDSSPRVGSLQTKNQTDTPVSAEQCPESEERGETPVASGMQTLAERLNNTLSMNDSVIGRSVKRNKKRFAVLSSSESEQEGEEPRQLSRSFARAESSGKNGNLSLESKDFENVDPSEKPIGNSSSTLGKPANVILSDSPDKEDDEAAPSSSSCPDNLNKSQEGEEKPIGNSSSTLRKIRKPSNVILSDSSDEEDAASSSFSRSDNLNKSQEGEEKPIGNSSSTLGKIRKPSNVILSDSSEEDDQAVSSSSPHTDNLNKSQDVEEPHQLSRSSAKAENSGDNGNLSLENKDFENSFSALRKIRKSTNVILSDSSEEDDDEPASSSSSRSDNRNKRPEVGKRKRIVLLSSDDDDDSNSNLADGSLVVTEELNVSINPSEPLLHCVKTPPAKVARSRLRDLEKSLLSPSRSDFRSPSMKSLAKMEGGPTLKSGVGESDYSENAHHFQYSPLKEDDDDDDDDESSMGEEDSDEEEEEASDEEEEETSDEEEESDDDIDLPVPSSKKSDSYNKYIKASREAYDAEDHVEALKQALRALKEDSSSTRLQKYALQLRKMTKI